MNIHRNRIIVVNFILSMLLAGASIAALILRILNDLTGINLVYFWPGCSQIYSTAKFSFAYKSIFIEFIANSTAVAFSLLAFTLLVCPFREVVCSNSEEEIVLNDKTGEIKVRDEALYLASSLTMLAWVVIVGKTVEYIFEGKYCTAIAAINNEIINYIDMVAGGFAFVFLCLTLTLIAQREPQDQEIKLQNFRSEEAKKNEQEMAKRINQEVQEYLNSMEKQKEDTKQSLLKYQQQVFGQSPSYLNQEYNETIIKDKPFNYKQRYTNQQKQLEAEGDSQYSYQYVEASDQEGEEGLEIKNNFGMHLEPSINQNGVILEEQNQEWSLEGPPGSLKGGPSNQAESPTLKGVNAVRDASPTLRGRNSKAAQSPSISRMTQDSSKPIILKKVEGMKKTTSNIVDDPKDPQSQIKQKEKEQEKPLMQKSGEFVNDEIQKLLRVTLYNNFRVQKESSIPEHQDHCPILKYVQKDQHYEINQPDYNFKGKSKKNNYEKEQLIFCRKRREQLPNKKQFDETATIKRQRSQIFGQKWSKEREQEEQERARQMSARFKKRNGLEAIRSKYCI